MPSHNVRAQAMWREAGQAEYRVVYWKQDITGGGYDFAESVLLRTRVGTTPTVAEKRYEHFHHARTEQGGAVTADGQTVYNVYHDRDRMSVIFKEWDYRKGNWVTVNTYTGVYGAPFPCGWRDTKQTRLYPERRNKGEKLRNANLLNNVAI